MTKVNVGVHNRLWALVFDVTPNAQYTYAPPRWVPQWNTQLGDAKKYFIDICGPILDVMQYKANPWEKSSKLQTNSQVPKIGLISMPPDGRRPRD